MCKDKKFERILGINSEINDGIKDEELEIKLIEEVNNFLEEHGEKYDKLCKVVVNPKNYEYDCRVAIFMMLGVKYGPIKNIGGKSEICPFGIGKANDGYKITSWCDDFQEVIILKNFNDYFSIDELKNSRIDRFGYHRLVDMQQSLIERIEKECSREYDLMEKEGSLSAEEEYELDMLQKATKNRKENLVLADIVLGISFSFTLYHGIKMVSQRFDVDFGVFVELIKQLSLLKCFQLRNIIADIVFQILYSEASLNDDTIKRVTDDVAGLLKIINQYYKDILTLRWNSESVNNKLNDIKYRWYYMSSEAESIGSYNECDINSENLVEKNINIINGIYREELEEDLKDLHDAKYNFLDDKEIFYIEGFPILNMGNMSASKKKEKILNEEYEKFKDAEIKMKITKERKKIVSNASVLFTYIHWEVMKMYFETMKLR